MFDRVPPSNLEAEQGVLGSVLLDNAAYDEVATVLKAEDFYRDSHQVIYRAVKDLIDAGKGVDAITLADELTRRGRYAEAGGDDYLAEVINSVPHPGNARYYAGIVFQKAAARRLIESANGILGDAYSNSFTAEDLLARAETSVLSVGERRGESRTRPLRAAAAEAIKLIYQARTGYSGLSTGLEEFDVLTDGLQPEQLVILAGRPSMGKSALALNWAAYAALDLGKPVAYFSAEMGQRELATRLLVSRSRVPQWKVADAGRFLGPEEAAKLGRAYEECQTDGLHLDDTPGMSVAYIASAARRIKRQSGLAMVVIDYLQILEAEDQRDGRQEQIARMSRRLKVLARELKAPVVALSQLNRGVENRDDKRPRMADLRESGAIEQDADVIAFVHRPAYYDPNEPPNIAELIVAKNRNGATKTLPVEWEGQLYRFGNLAATVPDAGPAPDAGGGAF
jgi:replicative DNA helicase